jgi:flavin reductase (DIM6/NTAB) family NADH-FMN oxidoreductase RutF
LDSSSFDARTFRQTVGRFATGVTVIVMELDGEIYGMTANSFTSLSLDPPLVLFCAGKATRTGRRIRSIEGFSVNILNSDQQPLSAYFAGAWKASEPPKFSFTRWTGAPRLVECEAALGCTVDSIHEGGDHWIVIGHVRAIYCTEGPIAPLIFFGGQYTTVRTVPTVDNVEKTGQLESPPQRLDTP